MRLLAVVLLFVFSLFPVWGSEYSDILETITKPGPEATVPGQDYPLYYPLKDRDSDQVPFNWRTVQVVNQLIERAWGDRDRSSDLDAFPDDVFRSFFSDSDILDFKKGWNHLVADGKGLRLRIANLSSHLFENTEDQYLSRLHYALQAIRHVSYQMRLVLREKSIRDSGWQVSETTLKELVGFFHIFNEKSEFHNRIVEPLSGNTFGDRSQRDELIQEYLESVRHLGTMTYLVAGQYGVEGDGEGQSFWAQKEILLKIIKEIDESPVPIGDTLRDLFAKKDFSFLVWVRRILLNRVSSASLSDGEEITGADGSEFDWNTELLFFFDKMTKLIDIELKSAVVQTPEELLDLASLVDFHPYLFQAIQSFLKQSEPETMTVALFRKVYQAVRDYLETSLDKTTYYHRQPERLAYEQAMVESYVYQRSQITSRIDAVSNKLVEVAKKLEQVGTEQSDEEGDTQASIQDVSRDLFNIVLEIDNSPETIKRSQSQDFGNPQKAVVFLQEELERLHKCIETLKKRTYGALWNYWTLGISDHPVGRYQIQGTPSWASSTQLNPLRPETQSFSETALTTWDRLKEVCQESNSLEEVMKRSVTYQAPTAAVYAGRIRNILEKQTPTSETALAIYLTSTLSIHQPDILNLLTDTTFMGPQWLNPHRWLEGLRSRVYGGAPAYQEGRASVVRQQSWRALVEAVEQNTPDSPVALEDMINRLTNHFTTLPVSGQVIGNKDEMLRFFEALLAKEATLAQKFFELCIDSLPTLSESGQNSVFVVWAEFSEQLKITAQMRARLDRMTDRGVQEGLIKLHQELEFHTQASGSEELDLTQEWTRSCTGEGYSREQLVTRTEQAIADGKFGEALRWMIHFRQDENSLSEKKESFLAQKILSLVTSINPRRSPSLREVSRSVFVNDWNSSGASDREEASGIYTQRTLRRDQRELAALWEEAIQSYRPDVKVSTEWVNYFFGVAHQRFPWAKQASYKKVVALAQNLLNRWALAGSLDRFENDNLIKQLLPDYDSLTSNYIVESDKPEIYNAIKVLARKSIYHLSQGKISSEDLLPGFLPLWVTKTGLAWRVNQHITQERVILDVLLRVRYQYPNPQIVQGLLKNLNTALGSESWVLTEISRQYVQELISDLSLSQLNKLHNIRDQVRSVYTLDESKRVLAELKNNMRQIRVKDSWLSMAQRLLALDLMGHEDTFTVEESELHLFLRPGIQSRVRSLSDLILRRPGLYHQLAQEESMRDLLSKLDLHLDMNENDNLRSDLLARRYEAPVNEVYSSDDEGDEEGITIGSADTGAVNRLDFIEGEGPVITTLSDSPSLVRTYEILFGLTHPYQDSYPLGLVGMIQFVSQSVTGQSSLSIELTHKMMLDFLERVLGQGQYLELDVTGQFWEKGSVQLVEACLEYLDEHLEAILRSRFLSYGEISYTNEILEAQALTDRREFLMNLIQILKGAKTEALGFNPDRGQSQTILDRVFIQTNSTIRSLASSLVDRLELYIKQPAVVRESRQSFLLLSPESLSEDRFVFLAEEALGDKELPLEERDAINTRLIKKILSELEEIYNEKRNRFEIGYLFTAKRAENLEIVKNLLEYTRLLRDQEYDSDKDKELSRAAHFIHMRLRNLGTRPDFRFFQEKLTVLKDYLSEREKREARVEQLAATVTGSLPIGGCALAIQSETL